MVKAKRTGAYQAGPIAKRGIQELANLAAAGKFEEAEKRALELYKEFPDRADVNDAVSVALVDQKKPGAALPLAEAAVKLEPKNAGYLVNLGRLYMDIEVVEDALPTLEKAMTCKSCPFQAPWAIADFFHETGKAERSIPYYEKAIEMADQASALEIQHHYLHALTSLGRVNEAEKIAERLLRHPRHVVSTTIRRASLYKHTVESPIFAQLREFSQTDALPDEKKSHANLEMGRIYENSKMYDEAFHCFSASKKTRTWTNTLETFKNEVDAHIRAFPGDVFQQYRHFGVNSEQPVFVVGMPRAGTTLTEQIIGAHPDAGGAGELKRIRRLFAGFATEKKPEKLYEVFRRVGPEKWHDVPNLYLRLVNYLAPDKKRVVDKMPHNFMMVGFISLCFPRARIIHVHRNPVDNFISAYQNQMSDFHGYSFDQVNYARYYLDYDRMMKHWNSVLPGKIFDLNYDELVQNPETVSRQLIDYVGLEWSDDCLNFHKKETTVRTFSKHQVRSAVNSNSVERWRNYEKHLRPMLEILGIR